MSNISKIIAPTDPMLTHGPEQYFAVGESALHLIHQSLIAAKREKNTLHSILDFACGHGRVMRHLRAEFPHAELTACDLLHDGVDFCAREFAANPIYSTPHPTAHLFPQNYDFIFVGSLFTHLDAPRWKHFLQLFETLLAPNGILLLTTHGDEVARRNAAGDNYGYKKYPGLRGLLRKKPIPALLAQYNRTGFAYLDNGEGFGISLAHPKWVKRQLQNHPSLTPTFSLEKGWLSHQDAFGVMKQHS